MVTYRDSCSTQHQYELDLAFLVLKIGLTCFTVVLATLALPFVFLYMITVSPPSTVIEATSSVCIHSLPSLRKAHT